MKKVLLILLFICTSCVFWENQKIDEDILFQQELNTLDLKQVDVYPVFEGCTTDESVEENKKCLENQLISFILNELKKEPQLLVPFYQSQLTFYFTSYPTNELKVTQITSSSAESTNAVLQFIQKQINLLPKLYPAQKRGIPVQSTFSISVEIK